MVEKKLFRQEALQKLSSPEQLNQAITITDSRGWLALIMFGIIIALIFRWLIAGIIPVTVAGEGILLKGGGLKEVVSMTGGSVVELNVKTGDIVTSDQLLVKVMRPEISDIELLINETEEEIEKRYENKEKNSKLIEKLQNKLTLLNEKKSILSEIRSPVRGKILNLIVKPGDIIKEYEAIAVIESPDETMEAVMYIPLAADKTIEPSMDVQISPSTARKDLYGFIPGKIKSVDVFPETRESMMKVIGNEELVSMFLSRGPSMEVHVELSCDANRELKWSSDRGGPHIYSGTLCRGTVILKKIHPLDLLFPSAE